MVVLNEKSRGVEAADVTCMNHVHVPNRSSFNYIVHEPFHLEDFYISVIVFINVKKSSPTGSW